MHFDDVVVQRRLRKVQKRMMPKSKVVFFFYTLNQLFFFPFSFLPFKQQKRRLLRKRHLKSEVALFHKLNRDYSISLNLSNVWHFFFLEMNSNRLYRLFCKSKPTVFLPFSFTSASSFLKLPGNHITQNITLVVYHLQKVSRNPGGK